MCLSEWVRIIKTNSGHAKTRVISLVTQENGGFCAHMLFPYIGRYGLHGIFGVAMCQNN